MRRNEGRHPPENAATNAGAGGFESRKQAMTGETQRGRPRRIVPLLAALLAVSGCAREEPYLAPVFAFREAFAARPGPAVPVLLEDRAWWRAFRDPALDGLVHRAFAGNLDLAQAQARLARARAATGAVGADASLGASARLRRTVSDEAADETRGTAALDFSWLIDPRGARFHGLRAARARAEAAEADLARARLLMLLNVAGDYVELRFQERVLAIRRQEIQGRRRTLALTRTLFEQEAATRLDVLAAEARLAETEAAIPGIEAAVERQRYRLAVLVGAQPGEAPLGGGRGQPHPGMAPETGIPADLIRNRPDIRAAEREYYAAVADTGAARAELYPSLSLGGALSLATVGDGTLEEAVFGPSLVLPALPGGPRQAAVAVRAAAAEEALLAWRATVLGAVLEVESALVAYAGASRSAAAAERSVRLYREAVDLTRELVERDEATVRDLIAAEEDVADAELARAAALRDLAQAYVELNVSLGAGAAHDPAAPAAAVK